MSLEELDSFLKERGIALEGSVKSADFLRMVLGVPEEYSSNEAYSKLRITNLREGFYNIFNSIVGKLRIESDNINYKELIDKILAVPEKKPDSFIKYDDLREKILNKSVEVSEKIKSSLDEVTEESIKMAINPIAELEEKKKKLIESIFSQVSNEGTKNLLQSLGEYKGKERLERLDAGEDLSGKISNKSENFNSSMSYIFAEKLSQISDNFISKLSESNLFSKNLGDKMEQFIAFQKEKITFDESKIKEISEKSNLPLEKIEELFKLAERKKRDTDKFSKELYTGDPNNLKFTLDEKSVSEIMSNLNLTWFEELRLIKGMYSTLEDSNKKLESIDKKSGDTGMGGILLALGGSLMTGLATLLGPILTTIGGLLLKISGIVLALGFLGKPLAGLIDQLTGTEYATGAVNVISNALGIQKNGRLELDTFKNIALAGAGLFAGGGVLKRLATARGRKELLQTGKRISGYAAPARNWVASKLGFGTKAAGAAAANATKAGTAAVNAANTAAKSTGMVTRAIQGLGAFSGAVGASVKKFAFGTMATGVLGKIFKRIPLIGGLYELGMAWKRWEEGDYKGFALRLLSASTNLLYLLGPQMAIIQIPLSLLIDYFDKGPNDAASEESEESTASTPSTATATATARPDTTAQKDKMGRNFADIIKSRAMRKLNLFDLSEDKPYTEFSNDVTSTDQQFLQELEEYDSSQYMTQPENKALPIVLGPNRKMPTLPSPESTPPIKVSDTVPPPLPSSMEISEQSFIGFKEALMESIMATQRGGSVNINSGSGQGEISGNRDEIKKYRREHNSRNYSNIYSN
jgi:hypothetical protein